MLEIVFRTNDFLIDNRKLVREKKLNCNAQKPVKCVTSMRISISTKDFVENNPEHVAILLHKSQDNDGTNAC